jgi:hypothetical protein
MLTAIGLCLFIMVMQLIPEFRDSGLSRLPTVAATAVAQ